MPTLVGSPTLESPKIKGWPEPSLGGGGRAATTLRAIVYTSARELLTEELMDEGGGRGAEGLRTEKEGTDSSRRASARVPSSQLEMDIKVQHRAAQKFRSWADEGLGLQSHVSKREDSGHTSRSGADCRRKGRGKE